MTNNVEKKAEVQDSKVTAPTRTNDRESSTDNGAKTQLKPRAKSKQPKYEVEKLETATSSLGEVFNAADLIWVKDLKARLTTAKIEYFYVEPRGTMAVYAPAEEQETGWSWVQGCCLVDTLMRV